MLLICYAGSEERVAASIGITSVYGENTFMLMVWLNAERYSQEIQLHKSKEVRNKYFEKSTV